MDWSCPKATRASLMRLMLRRTKVRADKTAPGCLKRPKPISYNRGGWRNFREKLSDLNTVPKSFSVGSSSPQARKSVWVNRADLIQFSSMRSCERRTPCIRAVSKSNVSRQSPLPSGLEMTQGQRGYLSGSVVRHPLTVTSHTPSETTNSIRMDIWRYECCRGCFH